MNFNDELDRVFEKLKSSVIELEHIKQQAVEIPVDVCTRKPGFDNICWPAQGNKLLDIYSLLHTLNDGIDEVRHNLIQFQKNKFQIIKEEEFAPKMLQPLIDYEIIQTEEEQQFSKIKLNANKLQKQIQLFQKKRG